MSTGSANGVTTGRLHLGVEPLVVAAEALEVAAVAGLGGTIDA